MNKIHPTAIIAENVILGDNNEIGAYSIIEGPTKIGDNNIIGHHVIIGSPGQDTRNPRYDSKECYIEIGNDNIIREFTAIQKPCYRDVTKLGNNIFLMQSVHIPHDAVLHDNVVITPMCVLAGITTILKGANVAMGTTIHQYSVIGHYSLAAMGSIVTKNIKPFTIFVSGKPPRVNKYAIEKFGFTEFSDEIEKYVVDDIDPVSDMVLKITEEFNKLHRESKRPLFK
jgi:UDP-N-acetylglucosamine acyltransferase